MKQLAILLISSFFSVAALSAQEYAQIVTYESSDDASATFTSVGIANKAKEVSSNAVKSLFYTLFYEGVAGVNGGNPLITNDDKEYVNSFLTSRYPLFVRTTEELGKPEKNAGKMFQANYRITIVYGNLIKELERHNLHKSLSYSDVEFETGLVLPTIMVVPYKRNGETYSSVLEGDFDRRLAVGKVQDGFEARNVTTVDVEAKVAAAKRSTEFGANDADSNDKQLILNSGADVYVVVDLMKDVNNDGSRVSLLMKAYETASGSILASKDAITKRYATASTDALCSYAIQDNLPEFLDDICKNFSKQLSTGKRVTLQQSLNAATPYRLNTANRWQEVEDFYFPNIIGVGDMVSTTTDLIAFIHALFDGAYVDSASLTHMLPPEGTAFGSGLMLMPFYDHTFYGHAGDTYGTHTAVMYNPSDSIAIAIAINGCATPRNDMLIGICSAIYDMEYEYPDFSQHQQYTASPDELAQYAGHFNSSLIDLPMHITYNEADGNLSLQLRGQPSLWLEAKSPGVFINSPTGVAISFKNPDRFIFKQFGRIIIYTRQ